MPAHAILCNIVNNYLTSPTASQSATREGMTQCHAIFVYLYIYICVCMRIYIYVCVCGCGCITSYNIIHIHNYSNRVTLMPFNITTVSKTPNVQGSFLSCFASSQADELQLHVLKRDRWGAGRKNQCCTAGPSNTFYKRNIQDPSSWTMAGLLDE
jgi:hypothetical protein